MNEEIKNLKESKECLNAKSPEENVEESITLRRKNTNISNIIMESLKRK